jgi:hypothetical protein
VIVIVLLSAYSLAHLCFICVMSSESAYGSVLHGYAVANDHAGARDFLSLMETGAFGISPGTTCYGGFILSCVRSRSWEEVLSTYETTSRKGIKLNASSHHGLIFSAFCRGGRPQVELLVHELMKSGAAVNQETCLLVLRIAIPELGKDRNASLDDIRSKLRQLGTSEGSLDELYARGLIRSLRAAELEDKRLTSDTSSAEERKQKAWASVLLSTFATEVASKQPADGSE